MDFPATSQLTDCIFSNIKLRVNENWAKAKQCKMSCYFVYLVQNRKNNEMNSISLSRILYEKAPSLISSQISEYCLISITVAKIIEFSIWSKTNLVLIQKMTDMRKEKLPCRSNTTYTSCHLSKSGDAAN